MKHHGFSGELYPGPGFARLARFNLHLLFSALGGKSRSGPDQPRLVLVFVIL
jgi:hypothetical protein